MAVRSESRRSRWRSRQLRLASFDRLLGWSRFSRSARRAFAHRFFEPAVPAASLFSTLAALAIILAFDPLPSHSSAAFTWPMATAGLGVGVTAFYWVFRARRPLRRSESDLALVLILLAVAGQGAGWGLSVITLLGFEPWLDAALLFSVAALGGAMAAAHGVAVIVVAAYLLPAFAFSVLALVRLDGPETLALAAMLAAYGLALLVLCRHAQRFAAMLAKRQRDSRRRFAEVTRGRDRLRSVLSAAPIPIVVTRIGDGKVLFINEFARDLFRFQGNLADLPPAPAFYEESDERTDFLRRVLDEGIVRNREVRMRRYDGEAFWALISSTIMDYEGAPALVSSYSDITPAKLRESELEHLAATDALTGVPNRRCFLQAMHEELVRGHRYQRPTGFLMIDLDHFKAINDTYGHAAGDLVLQRVAALLSGTLRHNDLIGRLGGEEFGALLPETGLADALTMAERLRAAVEAAEFVVESAPLRLTISIGAVVRRSGDEVTSLLRRADHALYRAKSAGRNRVVGESPSD